MRRVRVRAHHQLARQGVLLRHQRVRDPFRAFAARQVAVVAQPVRPHEGAVRVGQGADLRQQAALDMRLAAVGVGVVVLEAQDGVGLVQAQRVPERGAQHEAAHGGVDVMDEAQVGAHEAALAGRDGRGHVGRAHGVPGQDLGGQGLRARRQQVGRPHVAQPCPPVGEQPAGPQHGGGDGIAAGHQLLDVDRVSRPDAVDQVHVGGGEQAQVVGVLAVDALERPGDHQADAGELLRRRAVLARRSLAVAPAGHHHGEPARPHRADPDRQGGPGLHAGVGVRGQPLVEVHQGRQGGDLVRGHLVAQRPGGGRVEVGTAELGGDAVRVLGQEQDAPGEADSAHGRGPSRARHRRAACSVSCGGRSRT